MEGRFEIRVREAFQRVELGLPQRYRCIGAEVRQLLILDFRCRALMRTALFLTAGVYVLIDHDSSYPGSEIGAWPELVE
ncbi:hypothetical protein [Streptomyces chiangmaiensis]|uniref:Uncharacterized protein n=1 Tax=Streptomyces chiangmaiensis TaxID=766497 RepID=A0ABU7FXA3_9ACTN|nr:hypothetical protein [Streptomyces chiangmaiensis]MED7828731.1 hypothetical protein [Streptomyces chiangmaiensis]